MTAIRQRSLLALLVSSALVVPTAVQAQFGGDERKCRESISKLGSKLAGSAVKELVSCHKKRSAGKRGQDTDCNDLGQADVKGKVAAAAAKLDAAASSTCSGQAPADIDYGQCPAPCAGAVPAIIDFADVSDCIICLTENAARDMSDSALGLPTAPLSKAEAKCHSAIGKNQLKHFKTVIKERRKCQKSAEAVGATDTSNCSGADPSGKIATARAKAEGSVLNSCESPGMDLFAIDSCNKLLAILMTTCVLDGAEKFGDTVFVSLYGLAERPVTTTTSQATTTTTTSGSTTTVTSGSTTTTTLGGGQDLLCPATGEIVLYAGVRETPCTTNADCIVDGALVGNCDADLGRCVTVTNLDTGWTGVGHRADINDQVVTSGNLRCPGPFVDGSSEPCGQCEVLGLDTAGSDLCRCSNDNGKLCTETFALDAGSCAVSGVTCSTNSDCAVCDQTTTQACLQDTDCPGTEVCLVGLRSPTCVASQCVGSCDCYFGPPLPLSAGNVPACALNKFANEISGTANVDLGSAEITANLAAVVYLGELITVPCPYCTGDTTFGDGVRDGICVLGEDAGKPCDAGAPNLTFPSPLGDGHSLDCFPTIGKNVSGGGLKIDLIQTSGTSSISAGLPCGFVFNPQLCQCGICSGNASITCTNDSDCSSQGLGTCGQAGAGSPSATGCTVGDICVDVGGGRGQCETGPISTFCDGALRANGEPFVTCITDDACDETDCGNGSGPGLCGSCSLQRIRECFLPTITATGIADPQAPVGAAVFCIPATSSAGINNTAGLPGPARVLNQTRARTFCASDPGTEYEPGVGGCP